jgi:hypothetical protein
MIGASMADLLRLTYRELAHRLGLTPDGARFLARRRMWPIENSNDGRKVIIVAEAELATEAERTAGDRGMNGGSSPDDRRMNGTKEAEEEADNVLLAELRVRLDKVEHEAVRLRQQVADLRVQLATAQAEREAARAVAIADVATARAEVEAKDAVLAAKDHVIDELKAMLGELRAELTEARRPWWRRWIGS